MKSFVTSLLTVLGIFVGGLILVPILLCLLYLSLARAPEAAAGQARAQEQIAYVRQSAEVHESAARSLQKGGTAAVSSSGSSMNVPSTVNADSTTDWPSDHVTSGHTIAALKEKDSALEVEVLQLALDVRNENKERTASDLERVVSAAFGVRQNLQKAELAELERRIAEAKDLIAMREQHQQQIVERRVAELLDPNSTWDSKEYLSQLGARESRTQRPLPRVDSSPDADAIQPKLSDSHPE